MFRGDANDLVHVERVRSYADPKALVIACLDAATPDLRWTNGNRASRFASSASSATCRSPASTTADGDE